MFSSIDKIIQNNSKYLIESFRRILESKKDTVFCGPLRVEDFDKKLLSIDWKFPDEFQFYGVENKDQYIDYCLSLAITDLITDDDESDDKRENETETIGILMVLLDYRFLAKESWSDPKTWATSYFNLFSKILDLLNWPYQVSEFWPYVESRITWFKIGNNLINENEFGSNTNLISYRLPLSTSLRKWNTKLNSILNDNNKIYNAQSYIMKFKFDKFLSELLPINEESNFNRSGSLYYENVNSRRDVAFNNNGSKLAPKDKFAQDYHLVKNKIFDNPINLYFNLLETKGSLNNYLMPLLNDLLRVEDLFYNYKQKETKKLFLMNFQSNKNYPSNFDIKNSNGMKTPSYLKLQTHGTKIRLKEWKNFMNQFSSSKLMISPSFLELSKLDTNFLYYQMIKKNNDFFRKQFILQLCFVIGIFLQISESPEVRSFYVNSLQKDNPSKRISNMNEESNIQKSLVAFFKNLYETRIKAFYEEKDPKFMNILNLLINSDSQYLKAKIDGFKEFQLDETNAFQFHSIVVDRSFKKFGFIKLGNKDINTVWKIETGIDVIKENYVDPTKIYNELENKYESGGFEEETKTENDTIVKEWQTLRLLRSKYVFKFDSFDEDKGIKSLFDKSKKVESNKKIEDIIDEMNTEIKEPHVKKLQEARLFMKKLNEKKRKLEEEHQESLGKKLKPDDGSASSQKDQSEKKRVTPEEEGEINKNKEAKEASDCDASNGEKNTNVTESTDKTSADEEIISTENDNDHLIVNPEEANQTREESASNNERGENQFYFKT
ncbi:hypothetical protein TPHA_0C00930 [Tetrapisispora phaffii CBS 4417]|uniref:THO complex subunit HPR1 n=1 Tax=Tetrapisispora phaffii (strain ATCC 24235 / CBS 4417 / NBRC 1672 / NRRL Y-8282 / UCD 70-5) TaxID=1071381 RepID=G8BR73_TETPH|nr:hypothetical protein TPHA_0C00930 [Tetrapisispora phaffii CBS 4417]CCE62249.1 hypothetical protein TPHA_0C00930 [Tetrapisispora phaffii CBS 4417]